MKQLIPSTKLQETMSELTRMLTYFNHRDKALQIQLQFQAFLQTMKDSFSLFAPLTSNNKDDGVQSITPVPSTVNQVQPQALEHFQSLRFT